MIPSSAVTIGVVVCKPRASGDDPAVSGLAEDDAE